MQRHPTSLAAGEYDVLVVGGGAAGAAVAREAVLRGLSTALIERDDFGGGTSAHCFKVVHGGIRYLQHLDVSRMRASCGERAALLTLAPHLVAPLPFAIPTYGHGRSGRWLLRTGMRLYDALTADCNRTVADESRRIGRTRFISPAELTAAFPQLPRPGLTGAAVFEDGQMYNPPRLVLAFIAAASELGADVANYVEAERLLRAGDAVIGVQARDRLSEERFEIRARVVINAAGPWAEGLLQDPATPERRGTYSRDACFVIGRAPASELALAVQGRTRDHDALLARSARHLFLVPWRDVTLVGVWHRVVPRDPDSVALSTQELAQYLGEINAAHPGLNLEMREVRMAGFGLVPFGEAARQREGELSFGKQSRLIDHRTHGLGGLVSALSVRYTVARRDAVAALDMACAQLAKRVRPAEESATRPLPGGDIAHFPRFVSELADTAAQRVPARTLHALARNYGTCARQVLALAERDPSLRRTVADSHVLRAEVAYAVRMEMAQQLCDVLFRRTELGTAGHPTAAAIDEVLELMRQECRWSAQRTHTERQLAERHLARYLAAAAAPVRARSTPAQVSSAG